MNKHPWKNNNTGTLIPKQAVPSTVQWGMSETLIFILYNKAVKLESS